MVVIHKIIAYKVVTDVNFSRSFEKYNAKKFLTYLHKTPALYKMLQLEDAFISSKTQLEHEKKPFSVQLISFQRR